MFSANARRYRLLSPPWSFVILALLMIAGAFVYDMIFAGLPCPDPTPAMAASYTLHSQIASVGYMVGLFFAGDHRYSCHSPVAAALDALLPAGHAMHIFRTTWIG
jgi:hypothetical protein